MTYAATAAWLRPRLWIGVVVGLVLWVGWIVSLALGGWYKDANGTLIGADHLAFYTAAHLIRDGQQGRMYDYRDLGGYQHSLIGWNWDGFEAYRNPPFYALLYLPAVKLSYYASFLIWMAIGFGLLALSIWLLHPRQPARVLLWSVVFYPFFAAISFGQNTPLSLAIFCGVYRLLKLDRRFAAGLVAGLLWFKPQLLLGLFLWWVFSPKKYLRCWFGVAVSGAALAGVSWGMLPQASQAFVEHRDEIASYRGFRLWNVHTPKAFFELLVPESLTDALEKDLSVTNSDQLSDGGLFAPRFLLVLLPTLLISCGSIWIAWRLSRRSQASVATMFPVAVFLSLWASPHALIYEWALLIAASVVLWMEYPDRRAAWLCLFIPAWIGLTISTPFTLVQIDYLHLPVVLQVSIPILGIVSCLVARELSAARSPN